MKRLGRLLLLVGGFGLVVAGMWLTWDLLTTIATRYVEPSTWATFTFPLPFFIVNASNWTVVFDLALGFVALGVGMLLSAAYLLGHRR